MTRKELGDLTQAKDLSVMFIVEIWVGEAKLKSIKESLFFDCMHVVPNVHRGGRLTLLWKNSVRLSVETSSNNHIDCIVYKDSDEAWRFTRFYGEPSSHKRFESWDLFCQLNNRFNLPWLYVGDFNEILRSSKKKGGSNRSHGQMQIFKEAIDECGFLDLGYTSQPSLGKKTSVMGILSRRGWIEYLQIMNGYLILEDPQCITFTAVLHTIPHFGSNQGAWILFNPLSHSDSRRCGLRKKGALAQSRPKGPNIILQTQPVKLFAK